MSLEGGLFDPGLQPERTALSWRRTVLALAVVSVVGERVLSPVLGRPAFLLAGAGVVTVLVLLVLSRRRARAVGVSLRERGDLSGAGGAGLFVATTAACAAVGVLALAFLALRIVRG